jgi:hypothetical protein
MVAARGLRFRHVTDAKTKLAMSLVEELDGTSFFRVEFEMPFEAKTIAAMLQEGRGNPKLFETSDTIITYVTNTSRRTLLESAWSDESRSREWKTEFRSSLPSSFLESLERLRGGLVQDPLLGAYRETLLSCLYWGDGASDVASLKVTAADPNCRFDADMGQPCTEKQLHRIADAVKAGKSLPAY